MGFALIGPSPAQAAPGAVDWSFTPTVNDTVRAIAVQADQRILIGGEFTSVNGTARAHLARLNPDGTLDTSFAPVVDAEVNSIAVQPDGKILIGGNFTSVDGQTRTAIARLDPDGSLDSGFVVDVLSVSEASVPFVSAIRVQPDGGIIFGGLFGSVSGEGRRGLARVSGVVGSFG